MYKAVLICFNNLCQKRFLRECIRIRWLFFYPLRGCVCVFFWFPSFLSFFKYDSYQPYVQDWSLKLFWSSTSVMVHVGACWLVNFSKAVQQLGGQAPRSTTLGERSAFFLLLRCLHVLVNATYVSARRCADLEMLEKLICNIPVSC